MKKLLLMSAVESLGHPGDIVTVKDGYARNYLIPAGIAVPADPKNIKALEAQKKAVLARQSRQIKTLEGLANVLRETSVTATVQTGEEGKMFGAVTSADISDLLAARGLEVDKRIIALAEPIKTLGEHTVPVKLHAQVEAFVTVRVIAAE